MMQRQKSRYAPGTWQALAFKQLHLDEANGRSVMGHIETSLALPFLVAFLRTHQRLFRRDLLSALIGIPIGHGLITLFGILRGYSTPPGPSFVVLMSLMTIWILLTPVEKRHPGWRNGLQALLFHLECSTISERLPVLLEVTGWLHERPRLVTPETQQQFYTLLTETLSKTDTGVLETLEPRDVAALVALLTRQRKNTPETLLVAAILTLSHLRPEKAELRQALNRLAYHSHPSVRAAVQEFYRVAK